MTRPLRLPALHAAQYEDAAPRSVIQRDAIVGHRTPLRSPNAAIDDALESEALKLTQVRLQEQT